MSTFKKVKIKEGRELGDERNEDEKRKVKRKMNTTLKEDSEDEDSSSHSNEEESEIEIVESKSKVAKSKKPKKKIPDMASILKSADEAYKPSGTLSIQDSDRTTRNQVLVVLMCSLFFENEISSLLKASKDEKDQEMKSIVFDQLSSSKIDISFIT